MKITRVETLQVGWNWGKDQWNRKSAWVRVWADNGMYGLGEASPMEHGTASLKIIRAPLARVLTGADPLDTSVLYTKMFHTAVKLGPEGAMAGALAAVDIALWDLKGKILGQPVYKLLGGAWATRLPWYASVGGHALRSVDETLRNLESWLEMKPAAIKIRFDHDRCVRDASIAGDIAKARAVRKLVGDGFRLGFDANNGYSVQGAIRVGRELEQLGYDWFEEPVQHYHVEAMGKVADALDIAVSAGEQEYTLQGVARLIEAGVDIVQPDIVKTGGFTGLMDMAALCRRHGVDLVPHQTQPTVGHVANMHFVAALPHNHFPVEYSEKPGVQDAVFTNAPRPHNGVFALPEGPGLGLTLIEDELAKRLVK